MFTSVIKLSIGVLLPALAATSSLAGNNSGAAFSQWPGTGLTKCYNDTAEITCPAPDQPFYGQDAQYDGPARSYTKLDDQGNPLPESATSYSMVQDNVTGLIWEMKTSRNNTMNYSDPHDADNTYTWCDTNTATNGGNQGFCTINDTEDFINQLNTASFGGHADWRLPTMKELLSLVDYIHSVPTIDPVFASTTQSNNYWSSTTYAAFTSAAWSVSFLDGADTGAFKINFSFVRAVRGGQTPVTNRFVDNGDTVTDTVTCLQWQKATMDTNGIAGPDLYNWQQALAASENLSLAGHSDWRLPDIMEMKPLVDFSRYYPPVPAIAPVFESTTRSDYSYWSSTTYAGDFRNAWIFSYDRGHRFNDSYSIKSGVGYVRAVRSGNCSELFPWELFMPAINHKHDVVK
jgi:hypothetical protein